MAIIELNNISKKYRVFQRGVIGVELADEGGLGKYVGLGY